MASNFFADTFNKVKTPITEISWHKYVAGPPEEKIPGSCPGVAINRKFLLTSKSCHDAIEVNETVKSFVWYDKFFNGKVPIGARGCGRSFFVYPIADQFFF
jgi:hypothetical protein